MFPSSHFQEAEALSILQTSSPRKKATETAFDVQDMLTHKLPPELVSQVFTFCLPMTDLEQLPEAALSLGTFCREWCHLAWSSPRLWTTVSIVIPSLHYVQRLQTTLPKLVDEWLQRSHSLKLMINFFVDKPREGENYDRVRYLASVLLDTLKLHSEWWESLDLTLPLACFADKLRILSDMKNLEQFCLTSNVKRIHPQLGPLFSTEVAPTYLALSDFPFLIGVCGIAWDNIMYITLRSMYPEQCLEVATKAHCLETFRLWAISPHNHHHNSNVSKHPAIRSLEFVEGVKPSGSSFTDIIGNMELTSLEELTYIQSGIWADVSAHCFVARGSILLPPESHYVIWFEA